MGADFKWDPEGVRRLEERVQQHLEQDIAPRFQRERLDPLTSDLNQLSELMRDGSPSHIRPAVESAFRRHGVAPREVDGIVAAITRGAKLSLEGRVGQLRIDPPK